MINIHSFTFMNLCLELETSSYKEEHSGIWIFLRALKGIGYDG